MVDTLHYAPPPQRPAGWWLGLWSLLLGVVSSCLAAGVLGISILRQWPIEVAIYSIRWMACCTLPLAAPVGLVIGLLVQDEAPVVVRMGRIGIALNGTALLVFAAMMLLVLRRLYFL